MPAEWREFEKLIARIEQAMAPSGAVVKSPDWVPDVVTGELREVDASVRYKVGTIPVLITIECRDRISIEDVRWIEQLAEKRRSIGASITVAVSSSGFSGPAIRKAEAVGILVRTLKEAAADDFVGWLGFQEVILDLNKWSLAELTFELYKAPPDAQIVPELQSKIALLESRAPILRRSSDGKLLDIDAVLAEWRKREGSFFPPDLPTDGSRVRRNLHQPVDKGLLQIETTRGYFDVRVIHMGLLLSRTISRVPVSRLAEYAEGSVPLVQTAEWTILDDLTLSLHRGAEPGATRVTITGPPGT